MHCARLLLVVPATLTLIATSSNRYYFSANEEGTKGGKKGTSTPRRANRLRLLAQRVKSSPELSHFLKYATMVDGDGEVVMSPKDFFRSLGIENAEETDLLRIYFELADKDKNGTLSFSEYSFFTKLLNTENAEFLLAFQGKASRTTCV